MSYQEYLYLDCNIQYIKIRIKTATNPPTAYHVLLESSKFKFGTAFSAANKKGVEKITPESTSTNLLFIKNSRNTCL